MASSTGSNSHGLCPYIVEIIGDTLRFLYLVLYGTVFFVLIAPIKFILPRWCSRNITNEIVLIISNKTGDDPVTNELCRRLTKICGKVVIWRNSENVVESGISGISESNATEMNNVHYYDVHFKGALSQLDRVADKMIAEVGHPSIILNLVDYPESESEEPKNETASTSLLATSHQEIEETVRTNVLFKFLLCRTFLPRMAEVGNGHFIFLGGPGELINHKDGGGGLPWSTTRNCTSGFVESMKDEIRHECGNVDIKFTIVGSPKLGVGEDSKDNQKNKELIEVLIKAVRQGWNWNTLYLSRKQEFWHWLENFVPNEDLHSFRRLLGIRNRRS